MDGAIHRRGGPAILTECLELRKTSHTEGLPAGQAVADAGNGGSDIIVTARRRRFKRPYSRCTVDQADIYAWSSCIRLWQWTT